MDDSNREKKSTPLPGGLKAPSPEPAKETNKPAKPTSPDATGQPKKDTAPPGPATGPKPAEKASVLIKDVRKALRKVRKKEKEEEKKVSKLPAWLTWRRAAISLSAVLFAVMALSAVAGWHFRRHSGVAHYLKRLNSTDPALQSHARDSLAGMGAIAVPGLREMIEQGNGDEIVAAVDALALMDSPEAVELLRELVAHKNRDVRKRALIALGECAPARAFSDIAKQIGSQEHDTRIYAIQAIAKFPAWQSVPVLLGLLDDKDWQIRNEAAKALTRLSGENFGIPKSSDTKKINEMIRDRWRDWWEKNKDSFTHP